LEEQADAISWFQAALARAPEQAKPTINQAIVACKQIVASRSQPPPVPAPQYVPASPTRQSSPALSAGVWLIPKRNHFDAQCQGI
jgi:hypothetical protein